MRIVQARLLIDQYQVSGDVYIGNYDWNGVNPAIGVNRIVNEYTDVLPTANLALDIAADQKLRFAYDKAVARQDLPDLGRGLVVFYAVNGTPPRNPDLPADAVLWYQKDKLQARLAYNWRSRRYSQMNTAAWGDELAIWNEAVGYLDASISYDVTPYLTLYLQGTNLTGENERRYAQWSNQYYDQNIFERRYYVGLRLRF